MPVFDSTTRGKIAQLRSLRHEGTAPEVYELCRIDWPSGAVYYASLDIAAIASVPPPVEVDVRLVPDGDPNWFLPIVLDATIGDEEVDLPFWDADGAISDLLVDHGEGIRVEIFYWFPQVSLMLSQWHGHLRLEDEAGIDIIPLKSVQGFRSADGEVPHRAHWQECQAVFGGVFDTQAAIDEHRDCPYNRHTAGGATGNLDGGGNPYTFCPRLTQSDCEARLGNDGRFMLSHRTITATVVNNQTSGPRLFSSSQGNETNLKEPVRVIMGTRRISKMQVMAFRRDRNNNDPDHGWFFALYEGCEGPIDPFYNVTITVGNETKNAVGQHYIGRNGDIGQAPAYPSLTSHGYSGTSHFLYAFGWVDPDDVDPNHASGSALTAGLNNIRQYTDEDTYFESTSTNRVRQIARVLCDKRWGFADDYSRLAMEESWIPSAAWAATGVRFTDTFGNNYDHIRSASEVELIAKKVQQQIDDLCMAGRLSRPFVFNGKVHIEPLRALTADELAACPVFTDEGPDRNVIWEEEDDVERSTLRVSRKSDLDLPNRIEATFDDASQDYQETTAPPVEDIDAQLRAGRVVGDYARKINTKKYNLLGVTVKPQVVKVMWSILDLGPFDEGGLKNNLTLKFKIWFEDAIDLHPHKVFKYESSRLTKYGFTYFRIKSMKRLSDLQYEIIGQAYNETYMADFETDLSVLGGGGPSPEPELPAPPGPEAPPEILKPGTVVYSDGVILVPILAA
ncbi:MAG: hypothetical protein ABI539_07070 [Acidobacteriota bacterium]